ncbi:alpha/beta-Hydrolases superfamily protein [Euphorbia peplus]|nr:alpha/beta-Hydrolases superfamily protein [Euphorbia peplus]
MGMLRKFKSLIKQQSFRQPNLARGQTCCYSSEVVVAKERALKKSDSDIKKHLIKNSHWQHHHQNQQSFAGSDYNSGMVSKTVVVLMVGLIGMVYQGTQQHQPPQQEELREDSGEAELRIRLKDGRVLAYREQGVAKEKSKFKIVIVHGFGSSKEMNFPAPQV